jgi:F-type H+-transporting ATPase subunit delta
MAELTVVRRYARALFDSASRGDAEQVDRVEADLRLVDDALRAEPRLARALRAPTIGTGEKQRLLAAVFGEGRVSPLTARFLALVVDRGREDVLAAIHDEFERLANEARGILPVEVTAAVPLSAEERARLARAVEARTGRRVIFQEFTDPELLGGVVLRMGDTLLDGSVRSRLTRLHQRLLAGQAL